MLRRALFNGDLLLVCQCLRRRRLTLLWLKSCEIPRQSGTGCFHRQSRVWFRSMRGAQQGTCEITADCRRRACEYVNGYESSQAAMGEGGRVLERSWSLRFRVRTTLEFVGGSSRLGSARVLLGSGMHGRVPATAGSTAENAAGCTLVGARCWLLAAGCWGAKGCNEVLQRLRREAFHSCR